MLLSAHLKRLGILPYAELYKEELIYLLIIAGFNINVMLVLVWSSSQQFWP